MPLLVFFHRFTKLLVRIALGTVYAHGKFDGDTIRIGSHRSKQIPSPGMVNLLLLLLRILSNNGLTIIMPLPVFLSQVYKIDATHCPWHGECAWQILSRYHSNWKPQKQSNPFTLYGKFAIAPVEIPFKQQVTQHQALARIFIAGLGNSFFTLLVACSMHMVNLVEIPFKFEGTEAIKSLHLVWQICYCSC